MYMSKTNEKTKGSEVVTDFEVHEVEVSRSTEKKARKSRRDRGVQN